MIRHRVVKQPNGCLFVEVATNTLQPGYKSLGTYDSFNLAQMAMFNMHNSAPANVPAPKVKAYYQDSFGVVFPFNKIVYVGSNTEVVFSNDIRRIPGNTAAFEEAYLLWLDAQ